MKKTTYFIALLLMSFLSFSQNEDKVGIIQKDKNGSITSVKFPVSLEENKVPRTSGDFFTRYLETSTEDQFVKTEHKSRRAGFIHDHYDQHYNGIKVEGAGYNFHYKNGRMYFANGHYVKIENLNTTPLITLEDAIASFLKYKEIEKKDVEDTITELLIKEITQFTEIDTLITVELVFRIYLISDHPNNNEVGFVNAHTGDVRATEPRQTHFLGTFETRYSGIRQADTDPVAAGHRLFDNTRGVNIHTRNMQNNTTIIANSVELVDDDNNWTAAEHAANNNDMGLDVHWGLQQIYDYLNNTHNINSFDDSGHAIDAFVRYGINTSQRDNASWDLTLDVLYFGQGVSTFRPLASIDVVAHEFGHGITDFQIGWAYTGERAAFHEGMSDIWGAILEQRIRPSATWRIGEQVTLNNPYLRNLQNTNDPNAHTKIANTFGSSQYNSGGTYVRSGVFSHWFYILVNGKSGINGVGNYYNVAGIGFDLAEDLIVEAVFNNFLDNTTTYAEVRTAMIAAAETLFCENSPQVKSVTDAWYAVGVGTAYSGVVMAISGTEPICSSSTFTVQNQPAGSNSISWSSSNTNGLTINASGNATRVSSYNGSVNITAVLTPATVGCSAFITKPVWVGNPGATSSTLIYPAGLRGVNPVTLNASAIYQFHVDQVEGFPTSWTWILPQGFSFYSGSGTSTPYIMTSSSFGNYTMHCRVNNACGFSYTNSLDIILQSGGGGTPLRVRNDSDEGVYEEVNSLEVQINKNPYPNPATDAFNIEVEELSTLTLTGPTGQKILSVSGVGKVTIPVADLSNGIYFLSITNGRDIVRHKVLIQH
jgi:bacillolysin